MNYGAEPADQVVRYSLEGTEVALRLSGRAAVTFAKFVAAVLQDQKKTHGKTRLVRLLREGKPLKFFSVEKERMREFAHEAKMHGLLFVPMRNKTDPKEQLLSLLDIFEHTASDLEETQKSIEKEKMRVAGIRGEIRSYFERYRQHARAKARGRKFDILKTSHSGKTYLNVEITRVENEFVRIMHEQGSTSIPAGDLPDDIREMLAYGDPLNITAMNQTDASLKSPVIRRAPSPAPAAAPVPQPAKKKVVVEDLDPPAGKPKIETPTHTGDSGSSSSGNMWVPPAHSPLPPMQ